MTRAGPRTCHAKEGAGHWAHAVLEPAPDWVACTAQSSLSDIADELAGAAGLTGSMQGLPWLVRIHSNKAHQR